MMPFSINYDGEAPIKLDDRFWIHGCLSSGLGSSFSLSEEKTTLNLHHFAVGSLQDKLYSFQRIALA